MSIQGYYLDGKTSKRINARLEVVNHQESPIALYLTQDDQESLDSAPTTTPIALRFKYADLQIESRLGNTPREIIIQEHALFVTTDNNGVDALIQQFKYGRQKPRHDPNSTIKPNKDPIRHDLLYQMESHLGVITLATLSTIIMVWALFAYGVPSGARYIAFQLPEFTTQKFGGSLQILDKTLLKPSELSTEQQADIQALVKPYITHYAHLHPELKFRKGMGANAFALPGGEIVFTDDFVNITQDDNELLAVFFHELGHQRHKHMTRRALQDAMFTLVAVFITGNLESVDLLIAVPTLLADLAYSRDFEREADTFALEALTEHNIPIQSFADAMQHLQDYYSEQSDQKQESNHYSDYLSTHPSTLERIDRVNKLRERILNETP